MATTEGFRICLLATGNALLSHELHQRSAEYESALRRLLEPLRLGHRLEFNLVDTTEGLWQVAMLSSSHQVPIYEDLPLLDCLDPELHREAITAGNLVFQTFNMLAELINQHAFTRFDFENFCTEQFRRLKGANIRPLIRAAVRSGEPMRVTTPTGDYSLFNLGAAPRVVIDAQAITVMLKVLDISLTNATVKPHRNSARQLGIRTRQVALAFETGLTCNSAIGGRLFEALRQNTYIPCRVFPTRKLSGEFHNLIMPRDI